MPSITVLDGTGATQTIQTLPAVGQGLAAASLPVVIASDQALWPATQPVSGTVSISGTVPVSGAFYQATQPVSLTALPALATGGNVIGAVTQSGTWNVTVNAALPTGANVIGAVTQSGTWNIGSITTLPALATGANVIGGVTQSGTWNIGSITTLPALPTGANTIGAVNIAASQTIAVTQATASSLNATVTPVTPTPLNLSSAATTNATSVKGSAGTLYTVVVSNGGAAAAFLKLYNKATAPTVGTDVPVLTVPVPASGVVSLTLGETGHRFATGIALAITNLVADSDTTAVAAAQVKVLLDYI